MGASRAAELGLLLMILASTRSSLAQTFDRPLDHLQGIHGDDLVAQPGDLDDEDYTTDEIGVQLTGSAVEIQDFLDEHGLAIERQVSALDNVYLIKHTFSKRRSKRSTHDLVESLRKDPRVRRAEHQLPLRREKRRIVHDKQWELPIGHQTDKSLYQRYASNTHGERLLTKDHIPGTYTRIQEANFNDPFFPDQWYLINEGQTGGREGYDVNVLPVWQQGITGRGVVVSILDDGIDHSHPDLQTNYDPDASADMNDRHDKKNEPMPNTRDSSNSHGTRCAGEVAAEANNTVCGVGIAFNAQIGGVRMLDGTVTDLLESEALTYANQYIDIYSASWGPSDDGKTVEGPGSFASDALLKGVTEGRDGKGSLFVWATGNGGLVEDDCSCDGYVSSIYTLSVGCISDAGLSTYFSEICPSTMAVIFTGGAHQGPGHTRSDDRPPHVKVVTTDLDGECTLEFQGTSSAAPLAAGCFALVLEANPALTWRDVQNLVVRTARIPNAEEEGWTVNGAGYHVNHRFGFGAIDCGKMVELAQTWETVPEQHSCVVPASNAPMEIVAGETRSQTLTVSGCQGNSSVVWLEHVQVHVELSHRKRGDLSLLLVSPSGTRSEILSLRPLDDSTEGFNYTFMTVHCWGEEAAGEWTLSVTDVGHDRPVLGNHDKPAGQLEAWSLTLWGWATADHPHAPPSSQHGAPEPAASQISEPGAHDAQTIELKHMMEQEELASDNLHISQQRSEDNDDDNKNDSNNGPGPSRHDSQEAQGSEPRLGPSELAVLRDLFSDLNSDSQDKRFPQTHRSSRRHKYPMTQRSQDWPSANDEGKKTFRAATRRRGTPLNGLGNPHKVAQRSMLDEMIDNILPEKHQNSDDKNIERHAQDTSRQRSDTSDREPVTEGDDMDKLLELLESYLASGSTDLEGGDGRSDDSELLSELSELLEILQDN